MYMTMCSEDDLSSRVMSRKADVMRPIDRMVHQAQDHNKLVKPHLGYVVLVDRFSVELQVAALDY
jgi:hypothetical protein